MKYFSAVAIPMLALALHACDGKKDQSSRTPKALFIIVDGIPADVIEKLDPPALKAIAGTTGYTRAHVGGDRGAYNQSPTISAPGYNCLITGTWSNKHNVWDNDIAEPNYNYWTIFRTVVSVNPDLTTGVFTTWVDNRTKLVGDGLPQTGGIKLTYQFDGLELDTVKYPHEEQAMHIRKIDDAVADEAARIVRDSAPDLSWVYLEYTDDMGHQFGDSPEQTDAVLRADQQIGRIWESIRQRELNNNEDWLIVITTDHGRDSVSGKNHGGQSDRERATWIVTNGKELNDHFRKDPGIVDIYPSVCNHLKVSIPESVAQELDGVSFLGEVDVDDFHGYRQEGKIILRWDRMNKSGEEYGEIFISNTNLFKTGSKDTYTRVDDVSLGNETFSFHASDSLFYKILLKTRNQVVNTWVMPLK
jgi:predicted AlkP superfamily pyrophosphatase or phosphodiesterase